MTTTDGATYSAEDLRRQLLRNGYTPLPNRDKRCFLEHWPTVQVTDDVIHGWRRQSRFKATGIRVDNGLAVIDVDIDGGEALAKELYAAIWNGRDGEPLVRYGKGSKEAWFLRTPEPFGRIHSRSFMKPGGQPDDPAHRVEIFGGLSPRQFGSFGAHTIDDDTGETKLEYRWDSSGDPSNVPLADLPSIGRDDLFKIVDRMEAILLAHKYEPILASTKGADDAERLYDLTPDMQFDLNTGDTVSLYQLRDLARRQEGLRCSAGWLEGPSAKRRDRCIVGLSRTGNLTVWESASGVTHMEAEAKPRDFEKALEEAKARIAELKALDRDRIKQMDPMEIAAGKALRQYAFCPYQTRAVVPVHACDVEEGMALPAFRSFMLPWSEVEVGPRGGEKRINPADVWLVAKDRLNVAGIRLRPDQPRPLFTEHDRQFVNAYAPPVFTETGGNVDGALDLLEQLLPNPIERHWFMDWLAYKFRHPGVPGPAVIMVARSFGTGRGTLGELLRRLFGQQYVKLLPFDNFTGQNYQSQYTEWRASSLVVVVTESSDTGESKSVYRTKKNIYEHVKELAEPRATVVRIIAKGEKAYDALVCCSCIIATNNPDAIPLPADDRRFAVLSNGEPRDEAFWYRINAWMDDRANIAAFADLLRERDIGGYNPYAVPLKTNAKEAMADLSRSDLDRALDIVLDGFNGECLVLAQVEAGVRQIENQFGFNYPDRWPPALRRDALRRLHRVGERNGSNWLPTIGDQRLPVYAKTQALAEKWTKGNPAGLRAEVMKNGSPTATGLPGNVVAFFGGRQKN